VARDRLSAYFWFDIAAGLGSKEAAAERDKLGRLLTQGQLAEAKALSETWKLRPPPLPTWWSALDRALMIVAALLALTTGFLGVRGKTWDEVAHRPNWVGFAVLFTAVLTVIVGIASHAVSDRVAEAKIAKEASEQEAQLRARFGALAEGASFDAAMILQSNAENASKVLAAQGKELQISEALRAEQTPIDYIIIGREYTPSAVGAVKDQLYQVLEKGAERPPASPLLFFTVPNATGPTLLVGDREIKPASQDALRTFVFQVAENIFCGLRLNSGAAGGRTIQLDPTNITFLSVNPPKNGMEISPEGVIAILKPERLTASFFNQTLVLRTSCLQPPPSRIILAAGNNEIRFTKKIAPEWKPVSDFPYDHYSRFTIDLKAAFGRLGSRREQPSLALDSPLPPELTAFIRQQK